MLWRSRGGRPCSNAVRLVHEPLPEMHVDELDLRVRLWGKTLRAPIIIAAMTGGNTRAAEINQQLACIAEKRGLGFGLGSQRAMHTLPQTAASYQVRQFAPTALLLGNIGSVQATSMTTSQVTALVERTGADALCIHMNPAMEVIQEGGDRDFRGGFDTFARLSAELSVPVIAKETGCGVGPETARRLAQLGGLRHRRVRGGVVLHGWVSKHCASGDERKRLGELLWDWGIPTAAAVALAAGTGLATIATGGITTGLDIARAIVLGADAAGIARGVFQALVADGPDGADLFLDRVENELRTVMMLTGCRNVKELQRAPRVVTGELQDWVQQLSQPSV